MTVLYNVLQEVTKHLHMVADDNADFEFNGSEHQIYLDTIALIAKVEAIKESLGDRI